MTIISLHIKITNAALNLILWQKRTSGEHPQAKQIHTMSTNQNVAHKEGYQTQSMEELENKENNLEVETLNTSTESTKPSAVHLECDEILKKLGGFGRWQWLNFSLLSLPVVMSGLVLLTYSFTGMMK